ncbi:MAG: hypothetical protein ABJE10_15265 [bacterium]
MIIGHLGVAFATRARWPKASFGWLLVATTAPDIWRVILSAAGYAWWPSNTLSHTLPWSAIVAVTLASIAWLMLRDGVVALLVAALVASHIALDMISGWKLLWIGGPAGLDLQHIEIAELALEGTLAWLGWRLLPRGRAPRWLTSRAALVVLLAGQAAYLAQTFHERPEATRCLTYPIVPCWKKL